jgi:outer membrane protein
MNKRIIFTLLGFALAFIETNLSHAQANRFVGNYAVINSEKIFSQSDLGKKMQETLKKEFSGKHNDIRLSAVAIRQAALDLDKNVLAISPEEFSSKQAQLRRRDAQLQEEHKIYTRDLNQRSLEERSKIAEVANSFLREYGKKAQISIIVQGGVYVNPSSDITDLVIQLMNGSKNIDSVEVKEPKEITVASVNAEQIFNESNLGKEIILPVIKKYGNSESDEKKKQLLEARTKVADRANAVIKSIAEANKIDIIIQNTGYASSRSDVTQKVINVLNGSNNYIMNGLEAPTAVAVINADKLFEVYKKKNRAKISDSANKALREFAEKNSINIILQTATYVTPAFDVTDPIIGMIIPPKEDEISQATIPESKAIILEKSVSSPSIKSNSMDDYKKKCGDLGFKAGTEGFGKCVLQLSR